MFANRRNELICSEIAKEMAERVGFEPTVRFPVRSLSRRVLSTAQSPLRGCDNFNPSKASVFGQSAVASTRLVFLDSSD